MPKETWRTPIIAEPVVYKGNDAIKVCDLDYNGVKCWIDYMVRIPVKVISDSGVI